MSCLSGKITACAELCKIRISFAATLSAVTGFLVAAGGVGQAASFLAAAVFLTACGACALNQYQERDIDRLMARTKERPLPSGRTGEGEALYVSGVLIISGIIMLVLLEKRAALVALASVVLYNGLYARLKRVSAFSAVPGALVGAMPPAIGWAAAGGLLSDPKLLFVCFFFFMWQVPHFWLLLMRYGAEYEKAGLPCITAALRKRQLARLIFAWITAGAVSCIMLASTGVVRNGVTVFLLISLSAWPVWTGARLLRSRGIGSLPAKSFDAINLYILCVMLLLSLDGLVGASL